MCKYVYRTVDILKHGRTYKGMEREIGRHAVCIYEGTRKRESSICHKHRWLTKEHFHAPEKFLKSSVTLYIINQVSKCSCRNDSKLKKISSHCRNAKLSPIRKKGNEIFFIFPAHTD